MIRTSPLLELTARYFPTMMMTDLVLLISLKTHAYLRTNVHTSTYPRVVRITHPPMFLLLLSSLLLWLDNILN